MYKVFALLALTAAFSGCAVTSAPGTTMAEYSASCKKVQWLTPTIFSLAEGGAVVTCGDNKYHLVSGGSIQRTISKAEAVALIDDSKCLSWGVQHGEPEYQECRLALAQIRAQQDAARQQRAAAALQSAIMLNALTAPSPAANAPVTCTSTVMGSFTSYTCQ